MTPLLYVLPVPRFFSQLNGGGGCVAHARGVLEGLVAAGCEPWVVAEENASALDAVRGCRVHVVPCSGRSLLHRMHWSRQLLGTTRALHERQPFAFAYVRYSAGFTPWLPVLRRTLKETPLVLEVNSVGSQRHAWMKILDRRALQAADLVVCVSEPLREVLLALLGTAAADRVLVVPNGVDVKRFSHTPAAVARQNTAPARIGYTGVLKPHYGLENLVDAFRILSAERSAVELHIYGDGEFRPVLEGQARGLPGAHFHGMIEAERIPALLQEMDVLVGTTSPRHRFQSPIKLYEYMASGRPLVYASTPQSRAALGESERGLLYSIGNPDDLAAKLARLLDDRGLAAQLGRAAQAEARRCHSWQSRVERMLAALRDRALLPPLPYRPAACLPEEAAV